MQNKNEVIKAAACFISPVEVNRSPLYLFLPRPWRERMGEAQVRGLPFAVVGQALPDNAPAKGHLAAFTLIELLVVVLIIGILAAVAVPQYQKAVEKSRLTEALTNMKTLQNSMDVFLLENGFPQTDVTLEDLDATGTLQGGFFVEDGTYFTKNFIYECSCSSSTCICESDRSRLDEDMNSIEDYYSLILSKGMIDTTDKWAKQCFTQFTDIGRYICRSLENQGFIYVDNEV